jgi:hypothetical protein
VASKAPLELVFPPPDVDEVPWSPFGIIDVSAPVAHASRPLPTATADKIKT